MHTLDRSLIHVAVSAAFLFASVPAKAEWAALSWDACGAQVLAKSFACDSNAGETRFLVSALRDSSGFETTAFTCSLDVVVAAPQLPPWWQMGTAECRAGALTKTVIPNPLDGLCADAWGGYSHSESIRQVT